MKKVVKIIFSAAVVVVAAALAVYSLADRVQPAAARAYEGGGFVYAGALRNGLFDGKGEVAFADGARFSGGFVQGRAAGGFVYTSPDHWRFEGSFDQGKPAGTFYMPKDITASLSWADTAGFASPKGWKYRGGIGERGQNGEGEYIFPGGESYTGAFLLGLAEGRGVYKNAKGGVIYEGEWKAGLYHGQGKYTQPGGSFTYEGAFEAGLPHGQAKYTEGKTLRYSGMFQGGVPQGQGVYYSPEGWTYEGGFANGVFHGKGTLTRGGQVVTARWVKGRVAADE